MTQETENWKARAEAAERLLVEAEFREARMVEACEESSFVYDKMIEGLRAELLEAREEYNDRAHAADVFANEFREARETARRYREALEWYAQEGFYQMTSFRTAAPLQDLSGPPRNIVVEGSPILHDAGKRARAALAGDAGSKEGET